MIKIRVGAAVVNELVGAATTGQCVVAAAAVEHVVVGVARNRVVEVRAADAADQPVKCVGADRGVSGRRASREIDRHPPVALNNEMRVLPLPVMVSLPPIPSNSLKVVPRLEIGRGAVEAGRHIGIGEVRAAHRLDRDQRIGANRGVANHGAGRHVDVDAGGRPDIAVIDRLVEAAAAIERVIAGAAVEYLGVDVNEALLLPYNVSAKLEPMIAVHAAENRISANACNVAWRGPMSNSG